ncbi:hypothetical protein MMC16_000687 [Acarospora aff. strigata]|nr:hypothetical protein [Acarospora aff. strigata]
MFAAKSTLFFALFAVSTRLAVAAVPPACLLAAVNTQPNPADLNTICGSDASKVQGQISKLCGSNTDAAMSAFSSTCSAAGKTVSSMASSTSSTGSSSASATSGSSSATTTPASASGSGGAMEVYTSTYYDTVCSCTKTMAMGATGAGSSGFATATSGVAAATGGAISSGNGTAPNAPVASVSGPTATPKPFTGAASRMNLGSFAGAVIAVAGVVVAL